MAIINVLFLLPVIESTVLHFCALVLAGGVLFFASKTASVTLAWDPPRDKGIAGYRIYYSDITNRKSAKAQSLNVGRSTRFVVPKLVVGHTYVFSVTALNERGKESLPSDTVKYVVRAQN